MLLMFCVGWKNMRVYFPIKYYCHLIGKKITAGLWLGWKIILIRTGRCGFVKFCRTLLQLTIYFYCNFFVFRIYARETNEPQIKYARSNSSVKKIFIFSRLWRQTEFKTFSRLEIGLKMGQKSKKTVYAHLACWLMSAQSCALCA